MRSFDHTKYIIYKNRSIPYKYQGRDFDGVDCWGLVYLIYKNEFNILLPTYVDPSMDDCIQNSAYLIKGALPTSKWRKIPECQAGKGDVILITIGNYEAHIGVVIPKSRMLHTFKGSNTCLEHYDTYKWRRRISGFYTYEG